MTQRGNLITVISVLVVLAGALHFDAGNQADSQASSIRASCRQNNAQLQQEINHRAETTTHVRDLVVQTNNDLSEARFRRGELEAAKRANRRAEEAYTKIVARKITLKPC